jgi:hypothetical protein
LKNSNFGDCGWRWRWGFWVLWGLYGGIVAFAGWAVGSWGFVWIGRSETKGNDGMRGERVAVGKKRLNVGRDEKAQRRTKGEMETRKCEQSMGTASLFDQFDLIDMTPCGHERK